MWWMTRPSVWSKWELARVALYSINPSSEPHLTLNSAPGVKNTLQDDGFRVDQKGSLTSQSVVQDVQQSPGHLKGLSKPADGATLGPWLSQQQP